MNKIRCEQTSRDESKYFLQVVLSSPWITEEFISNRS